MQKKIGLMPYDFLGMDGTNSVSEWKLWSCHKRFGVMCYTMGLLYFHFLNGFFLNNNLLIPPIHAFPIVRLLLWFGLGSIGYRESYLDVSTWNTIERKYNPVEGRYRWLVTGTMISETILCFKYRYDTGHIDFEAAANTPFYNWGT